MNEHDEGVGLAAAEELGEAVERARDVLGQLRVPRPGQRANRSVHVRVRCARAGQCIPNHLDVPQAAALERLVGVETTRVQHHLHRRREEVDKHRMHRRARRRTRLHPGSRRLARETLGRHVANRTCHACTDTAAMGVRTSAR